MKSISINMDEEALDHFTSLHKKVTGMGSEIEFGALVLFAAALKQVGATQKSTELLLVNGKFESWEELLMARYSFAEYRELEIPYFQALLLANIIKPTTKLKAIPPSLSDRSLRHHSVGVSIIA